jgi:hypothetical protein
MKISNGLNKNKSQIILAEKLNPNCKSIETITINRPLDLKGLTKKNTDDNNDSIKVNRLTRYIKLNKPKLRDLREAKSGSKIKEMNLSNNNIEKSNSYFYSSMNQINNINNSLKENTPHIKGYNKISFFRPSNNIAKNFVESTKNTIKKKLFVKKIEHKELNKTFGKYSNKTMSSKFIQAKEKWTKNYFATVIQKIFRGYIFRSNFLNKANSKNKFNIYIKKMPKDKSYLTKFIKIKNSDFLDVSKQHNRSYINKKNDKIGLGASFTKTVNSKQYNKIKEIVIKKKKNCPIVNLNMNNYFMPNYICQYNNCTYNSNYNNEILLTYNNNTNSLKYYKKSMLNSIFKKIWKHWTEIAIKSKILSSIVELKKKNIKKSEIIKDLIKNKKVNYHFSDKKIEK